MWLLGDVTALPASGVLEVSEGSIQVVEPTPPAFLGWEPPLPPLSVGEDVSADLVAAQVGFPAAVYEVSGGRLPEGLVLDPVSGSLTGVPTTAGDFAFTVRAVNVGGSDERSVSGTVAKGATALTAIASPSRAPYGAQVTLAAAGLPPVATGSVDFLVDGESVCVVTLPELECGVTGLMPGDHLVEAVYSGDVNWEGSRVEAGTVTVDRRPATLQGAAAAVTIERGDAGSHPLSFVYSGDDLTEAAAVEGGTLEVTSPPVIDPPGPSPQPSPEPEPEPAPTGDSPQPQPTRQDVAAASSRNASPAVLPHAGGPAMAFVVFGLIAVGAGAALIRARRRPREDSNLRHTL
ncbi:Ig-like domain repeat protein [Aeromicrobium camelliae]